MATQRTVAHKPRITQKALIKSPYVYFKFNGVSGNTTVTDKGTTLATTKTYPINGTLNAVWSTPGFVNPSSANSNYIELTDQAYKDFFQMNTLAGTGQLLMFYEVKCSAFTQVTTPSLSDQYIFSYGHFSGANSIQVYLDKTSGNFSHRLTDNAGTIYQKAQTVVAGTPTINKICLLFDFINQQVLVGANGLPLVTSTFTGATFGAVNSNRKPTFFAKSDTSPGLYLGNSIFLSEFACFRITGDISNSFSNILTVWNGTEAHSLPWVTLTSAGI